MSGRMVPDGLWEEIEPLFPVHEPSPDDGRPPVDNRTVFTLLVFRAKTGMGGGTCRPRWEPASAPSASDAIEILRSTKPSFISPAGLIAYQQLIA